MTTNTNAALRSAAKSAMEALEALNGIDTETESVTIHVSDEIAALRAALTAAAQPPEGWVMVPVEATVSMREAMQRGTGMSFSETKIAYNSMLAAAPKAAPQPAVQQGDELPREDFAWLVVQEACETEPADEDDPECIRILRRDLKSAVLSAFLRHDAAHPAAPVAQGDALTYEQQWAIRQGHEIAASDSYFDARPQIDNNDRRKVFEAGFERGWDAARAQAKEGEIHE